MDSTAEYSLSEKRCGICCKKWVLYLCDESMCVSLTSKTEMHYTVQR